MFNSRAVNRQIKDAISFHPRLKLRLFSVVHIAGLETKKRTSIFGRLAI